MKKFTKGLCLSSAIVAAGAMMSTTAMAAAQFTVDEGSVPGAVANTVLADKINGTYKENVEFLDATNFAVSIGINFNNYTIGGGLVGANQLVTPGSIFNTPNQYSLYATFLGAGTYAPAGGGATDFTFNTGTYQLWVDANTDSALTASADGQTIFAASNTADDYLIATGSVLSGGGELDCAVGGINCGSFGTDLDVVLTDPAGLAFFSDPDPFFELAFTSGDFQAFDVVVGTVQEVDGQISLVFEKVPEPATLALFGLGLAGMAGAARRKAKKA